MEEIEDRQETIQNPQVGQVVMVVDAYWRHQLDIGVVMVVMVVQADMVDIIIMALKEVLAAAVVVAVVLVELEVFAWKDLLVELEILEQMVRQEVLVVVLILVCLQLKGNNIQFR